MILYLRRYINLSIIYVYNLKYVDRLIHYTRSKLLPKWKKDADHFTVSVNHHNVRGYQSSIPKPVMETLGNPDKITFMIKSKKKVELVAGEVASNKKDE